MKRRLLKLAVAFVILAGIVFWIGTSIHASMGYSVQATFTTLPPNDDSFIAWLKAQAGIVQAHVDRETNDRRAETVLRVRLIQVQNLFGRPGFPEGIDRACEQFGYGPPGTKFQDARR
ncbi:MAG: hypothetical protein ACAI43_18520 [Phycisphaerae bacterium]